MAMAAVCLPRHVSLVTFAGCLAPARTVLMRVFPQLFGEFLLVPRFSPHLQFEIDILKINHKLQAIFPNARIIFPNSALSDESSRTGTEPTKKC